MARTDRAMINCYIDKSLEVKLFVGKSAGTPGKSRFGGPHFRLDFRQIAFKL
jgi:hypothetical protein